MQVIKLLQDGETKIRKEVRMSADERGLKLTAARTNHLGLRSPAMMLGVKRYGNQLVRLAIQRPEKRIGKIRTRGTLNIGLPKKEEDSSTQVLPGKICYLYLSKGLKFIIQSIVQILP